MSLTRVNNNGFMARTTPRKAFEWTDSENRFRALVSPHQDCCTLVRLELRVPYNEHNCTTMTEDNLFLGVQEKICLRPYLPANGMLAHNPNLCEVIVRVDNFWCANESGGNGGRPIRRGTACVSGDADALERLRGETGKRFTGKIAHKWGGVRGLKHVLENGECNGLHLGRMRAAELAAQSTFTGTRWLCVDYSETPPFHCKSIPRCSFRKGGLSAYTDPNCKPVHLYLHRDSGNIHDPNAVAVVQQERVVVGFLARELAACIAPAMDAGVIEVAGPGLYSKTDLHSCRIWFKFNATAVGDGAVGVDLGLIQEGIRAIPWWSEIE